MVNKQITILCNDALEGIWELEKETIDLVVTSPPYNLGIEYDLRDDFVSWEKYEDEMVKICRALYVAMKPGGRVCWQVGSFSSKQNWYELFLKIFKGVGFQQYAEIIWDKKQISSRTAWGSFKSASQPNILPRHEYIIVFYKEFKNHGKGTNNITNEEFVAWTNGMWEIKPETNSKHPAAYPLELVERCIKMFSHEGDLVLDPFLGSGTTALAAKINNRQFIGFDISEEYCKMAKERVAQQNLKCADNISYSNVLGGR